MGIASDSLYTWQDSFLEDNQDISPSHILSGDISPHRTLLDDIPIAHCQMTSEANTVIIYRSWWCIRAYGWRLSPIDSPIAGTAQNTEQRTHNTRQKKSLRWLISSVSQGSFLDTVSSCQLWDIWNMSYRDKTTLRILFNPSYLFPRACGQAGCHTRTEGNNGITPSLPPRMCMPGTITYNPTESSGNPEMWTATPWFADKVPETIHGNWS